MSSHGHSHGGEPCNGHHGDVIDDPSLLEPADRRDFDADDAPRNDGWEDILGSSSLLIKKERNAADDDDAARSLRPQKGQQVTLTYTMTQLRSAEHKLDFATESFEAPTNVDKSVEKHVGRLSEGDFIPAIDMVAQLMVPGTKTLIRAQARHCFLTSTAKNDAFPKWADLYIVLELVSVGDLRVDPSKMQVKDRIADAENFNSKGNDAFASKDFGLAAQHYKRAIT